MKYKLIRAAFWSYWSLCIGSLSTWNGMEGRELRWDYRLGTCSEGALVLLATRSDAATYDTLYFTYEFMLPITDYPHAQCRK